MVQIGLRIFAAAAEESKSTSICDPNSGIARTKLQELCIGPMTITLMYETLYLVMLAKKQTSSELENPPLNTR